MARIDLVLRIVLADPPSGVVFSLQDKTNAPVDAVLAGEGDLAFDIPITLTPTPDGLRAGGTFVRADGRGRFIYVASAGQAGDATAHWSRRAKIYLGDLPDDLALATAQAGDRLEARIAGRSRDGGPACATVPLLRGWTRVRPS
jgi:hypothetical protein